MARAEGGTESSAPLQSVQYFYAGGSVQRVDGQPAAGGSVAAGSFVSDQIGVLAITTSEQPRNLPPIVMSPGFGLAGHIYLTTADGRPGWAYAFLGAGHSTYLIDRSHTSRTGFDVFAFNDVRNGRAEPGSQPRFVLWLDERIWTRWGLGPDFGEEFDDGQFPVAAVRQLMGAFAPVVSESVPLKDQARGNVEGLIDLLEQIGPAIVMTHSASGRDGFQLAARRPDLVRAIVTIEPVGCDLEPAEAIQGIPVLSVFGDHLEVRPQMKPRLAECVDLVESLKQLGSRADLLSLPDAGIHGNSHIMMSDRNSDHIAEMIIDWIRDE